MQVHLSVIIPAYNEAENISTCINSVKTALAGLPTAAEIIVVDNASTDRTPDIASKLGCRVVHEPFRQIARARNAGAAAAAGEFLVFLDADTAISPGMLAEVVRLLKTGRIAGGGARIEFDAPRRFGFPSHFQKPTIPVALPQRRFTPPQPRQGRFRVSRGTPNPRFPPLSRRKPA